ncbi:hypothetical protein AAVH_22779 [Aphelenchoides avenae]|nr:hypothetical protein AAVH_22779 [Aphelenchus avenae]
MLLVAIFLASTARAIVFPLPDTAYPIPAGAIFVALNGNDANAGTAAAPLRNPATAVARVPAGGTIVFRGGSYYDVEIASVTKRITMQPYPHEKVWIKGSVVVTGWVVDGVTWRHTGIPFKFCQTCCNTAAVDPAYPNACRPDQVFLGSNPLVQVASKAAVTAGKFFVDYTNNFIYIGTNPGTQVVEVSKKWRAIQFNAGSEGSIVRGLGFAQYAPYWNEDQLAAVISNAASVTFESNAFVQSAGTSLGVFQPNNIVRNNYIAYNGYRGLVGNRCHGSTFEDNTIDSNNLERFRTSGCGSYCTVAGMKIAHADNLIVTNNYFRSNIGHGFWCDLGCTDSIITKNVATSNTGHGIFYEVSSRAIIASNIMAKNGACGLKVAGSDALRIYNNVFNRNTINMGIYDDGRSPSTVDPNYSAPLGLTWDTRNLQIFNNLLSVCPKP